MVPMQSARAEEHRQRAIEAVCLAFASNGDRPSSAYRELATEVVDHVTAHAVEVVRDLVLAEVELQPHRPQRSGIAVLVADTEASMAQARALQAALERLVR